MKTPISYYGGKQSMLKHILPLLPEHKVYVEPFFGGGAVFWAKEQAKIECINDTNGLVVNFYQQLKSNFWELKKAIDATPYSRTAYKNALVVYEHPYIFNEVTKAWAFWIATIQGFSNKIGSWRSNTLTGKETKLNFNKKSAFTHELSQRLELVQIEQKDAVELISQMDSPDTFFYIDPPYVGSNQGHYGGYMQEHFDVLLHKLSTIKGRFMLSSYPNDELKNMAAVFDWKINEYEMSLSASNSNRRKIECLTLNF